MEQEKTLKEILKTLIELRIDIRKNPNFEEAEKRLEQIKKEISAIEFTKIDISWLRSILHNNEEKWFTVRAVEAVPSLLEHLFDDFIRAAVYEINPSANRAFVEPCNKYRGDHFVSEKFFEYILSGTNFEKAGAINALYWVTGPPVFFQDLPHDFSLKYVLPESVEAWKSFEDVRIKKKTVFIKEFLNNKNIDVRRSIISKLSLNIKLSKRTYICNSKS